ncbi:MAG: hypothetical protein A2X67_03840 [Ignavibacteria bacterium GWA2_55_11]|nr:MAG: hypothetical protein A2X67_03840 [Ignavibacteria bacterium GWA2_55_11]OGU63603.1 MAG: hypothetical protein A3C56_12060 [Ignavibacteria bacterium RIFCSPHIGHO2_02_FULL_56_12]OGU73192.1 MAG: hypothetical protein A3H45_08410 [Ignavibacteria bacterium RIFCSPLOWO2_02_FULL_55_14]OGU74576.1 MAG: hypothetical protein A3G43_13205 [Ignavibacteria bacterium RIFCSPLOWO2_12_FULL_56_21]HAV23445.1 hypothetical protein [Bacteroidota bacterium]
MPTPRRIQLLFVEDAPDTVRLVETYLARYEGASFELIWKDNGPAAIREIESNPDIDLILMDYFLPGINGLETTRQLLERNCTIPIVFLTVNKDMDLVVEVMKLGVRDYIIKDDITSHVFPQTLVALYEKRRLQVEVEELEIRRSRLEAMQEMVVTITNEIAMPLEAMKGVIRELGEHAHAEKAQRYLSLIGENITRIEGKIEKLKNLREDKTVQYIKDIRMIDLS